MKSSILDGNGDAEGAPRWLVASVRQYHQAIATTESAVPPLELSPELQQRCREAGRRGYEVACLRVERQRVGRLLVPLAEYFETLAGRVHLALRPLYGVLGIGNKERLDRQSAEGLARLARLIGLEVEDAVLLLRLGYARVSNQTVAANGRGRRAPLDFTSPAQCAATLREIEGRYDQALLHELHQATGLLRAVYAEDDF